MAISIPRIQVAQSSPAMPQNDRINMKVSDNSQAITQQTNALASLGEAGMNMYIEAENEKISTLSYDLEKNFNDWNNAELAKLESLPPDVDPTEHYVTYEENLKKKKDELLGGVSDVSDRVRRNVEASFTKTLDKNNTNVLYRRGRKEEVYKNNAFENKLKLNSRAMSTAVGYAGFESFDRAKNDVIDTIAKRGLETGMATELPDNADPKSVDYTFKRIEIGPDGKEFEREVKVRLNDGAKVRIAKELQQGTREAIDTLIGAGELEKAKQMTERYEGYLKGKDLIQIRNKLKNEDKINEANVFLASVGSKLSKEQRAELESIEDPDLRLLRSQEIENEIITSRLANNPELLDKTLALKQSRDARLQKEQKIIQERNYTILENAITQAVESGEIYGLADLETNPRLKTIYNATWDKMSSKQKQAIQEAIISPAKSNPNAISKVQDLLMSEEVGNVSMNQFKVEYLTGLSKADKQHYETIFKEFGKPEMSKQRAINQRAEKFLKSEMLSKRVIKAKDGGKLSRKNQEKYDNARRELIDILSTRGNMNDADVQKYVRQYVAGELTAQTKSDRNVFGMRPTSANLSGQNTSSTFNSDGARYDNGKVRFNSPEAARAQITAYMQATGFKFNPKSESDVNRFNLWVSKKYGWN